MECNCSFAREIDQHAVLNEGVNDPSEALNTLTVVSGNNIVTRIPVEEARRATLEQTAKQHLQAHIVGKHLSVIGGVPNANNLLGVNAHYLKLPILAFCSKKRHSEAGRSGDNERFTPSARRTLVLDLHTSEVPIEVTANNADLTLAAMGLEEIAINGVLNIYVVRRYTTLYGGGNQEVNMQGKNAIFRKDISWEHPSGQSDRGLANLLSALRAFANLIGAAEMEPPTQDAILHVIYLLTRFPPAVRAVHVLMAGKTPRFSERAALAQCMFEVLKDVVPLQIIKSDETRRFEGSRLLLGLILEKAKNLKVSMQIQERLTYMDSMKVYDLRNPVTMEPVASPIQTTSGLAERGFYDAFRDGGMFRRTNGDATLTIDRIDGRLQRVVLLSGGIKPQVTIFDVDASRLIPRYDDKGDVSRVIAPAEFSDLQYLATLCSRNKLGVLHPSTLPSAEPPVLTLDRQGLLAVYVGRQACGEAGRDINMFRPTSTTEEESVDVSIITQLIVPILNRRQADGTAVFEAFGDQHRRLRDPDEIIMLAVDCSASMNDRCGFVDVEENEDAFDPEYDSDDDIYSSVSLTHSERSEDPAFERPALDELKTYLSEHESFGDMLAIIRSAPDDFLCHKNAEKVLELLRDLANEEMKKKSKNLEDTRRQATRRHYRQQADRIEQDLATLKNRSVRMETYKNALLAWLLYRAEHESNFHEPLTWTLGQAIPSVPKKSTAIYDGPDFDTPNDYICPISSELMDDPVLALDSFTYERKAIERWFQTNETSPFTRQVLTSLDLRPNVQMKNDIQAWIRGSDIIRSYAPVPNSHLSVTFKSPLTTWTISLPVAITLKDLYQISFRGTKGRYSKFGLYHRNALLSPSGERAQLHISSNHDVFIKPEDSSAAIAMSGQAEDLCLVKVYCGGYENNVVSYWEPKSTTKTLSSTIFRYYRHSFNQNPYTKIRDPFTIWTDLTYTGDSHFSGCTRNNWEPLSSFFNNQHATGGLFNEPAYSRDDDDQDDGNARASTAQGTQPLVLKIHLGGASRKQDSKTLSRLDVLKQMFDAFINRVLAYNFQTHIGLITFRSTASLTQDITHAVENFRHQLNSTTASGDTALWDALLLAQDQLLQYSEKFPKAKLRIICLSDGDDTKSKEQVTEVSQKLVRDNIVLDSFCLGEEENLDLQALSYLTGGYKFQPDTMEEAMAICELEPVLSIHERPDVVLPSLSRQLLYNPQIRFQHAKSLVTIDQVTRDIFPKRKEHPGLSNSFVELGKLSTTFKIENRTDNNLRLSRIHSEIRNSAAKIHPHYDVYICEPNFGLWKIVMQGPPDSAYGAGIFVLYLDMGEEYPSFAPKARFVTPIYHPNINRHGRICHSILDRNWTVDTTNKDLIDTIYSLLLVPEFSDPINAVVTLNFHWDEVQFKEEAGKHITKHATKTRAQWKREIVG
ncbi:uncharacterized protein BDR25DRAFT_245013 [Lindgomyces ingoldianus]|uniref:Uncharacterized protein n=1 Tax=Lindgomyces ingoldianus TaxID=673940 RepID=A0ACB6QC28_9PLEO|nr:uncharacterized protein BDR25DRAFT_245013 [Lindgomyces ingoldianus]KAF2463700.1 hypothetical protein BDR25DRAFT_245013 [Lindgomyces ingoldianus]